MFEGTLSQGLNIGGGGGTTKEIKLRLRESGSSASFLSYDFILGTMLHELVHNVHGPHNATFYALLDKINDVSSSTPILDSLDIRC